VVRLDRRDAAIAATITVIFFVSAAYNVGFRDIPSTPWRIRPGDIILTLTEPSSVSAIYIYASSDIDITASFSVPIDGMWRDKAWMNNHTYYKWIPVEFNQTTTERIRMRLYFNAGDIFEVAAVDTDLNQIVFTKAESPNLENTPIGNLIDEQGLFENPPTYRSESMFDEELFVRASQQLLNGEEPTAEETHPPLGKLIIAASISILGFNPFAWRIPAVLFASLMIPIIYALGLRLFKTRSAATIASTLLALDFMHFTMGRVGTVDTYLLFFILLSTLLFYLNYEKMVLGAGPDYRLIALALVSFSLAFSVKWIAIFGFFGEAVLFLIAGVYGTNRTGSFGTRLRSLAKPIAVITCLTPLIGAGVYFATWIPYAGLGHDLGDIWAAQWGMLGYHSDMGQYTHPNASGWYEWPLALKFLPFTSDRLPGDIYSGISALGNPILWWIGLVAIILSILDAAKLKWPHLFLGALYLAQLIPYALISRYLFIYHYYAEVPLLALATAGLTHELWYTPRQRKYIILLIAIAAIAFAAFYPVISGQIVPRWYIDYLRVLGWRF
jgi:predicted membrane-bound dolichyl-phosphate-mannose-protein mannosyltransferase